MKKKILSMVMSIVMVFSFVGVIPESLNLTKIMTVEAAGLTINMLKEKFPHGKYWNHPGSGNNPDGYTSTPCSSHKNCDYYGNCSCNSFSNAIQCMGYAYKLAYDVYGSSPRNWSKIYNMNSLKAGDVIRYKNNGHSIFVTAVNGSTITYTDCNSDGKCKIRWDQTISKSNVTGFNYVQSAPYELPNRDKILPGDSDNSYSVPTNVTADHKIFTYDEYGDVESGRYIASGDACYIDAVYTNGFVHVKYPTSSGERWAYAKRDDFSLELKPKDPPKPTWSSIRITNEKYVFNTNEEIHFTANSDTATSYWIGIDKDGARKVTKEMPNGDFSISFSESGNYSAYVTASNTSGSIDSAKIDFKVFSPVDLGDEREVYIENVQTGLYFTVNCENNGTENVYGAEKGDTTKQLWKLNKQSDGTYRIALVSDGRCLEVYQAGKESGTNVNVWQENPEFINQKFVFYRINGAYYIKPVCSDMFLDMGASTPYNVATYNHAYDWGPQMFNIIDVTNAPTWADIKTDNYRTNYNVDEVIKFSFNSDNATEYYVNIDKDNKRLICDKNTTGEYSISFKETGYYTACVTARNSNGWIDSEYIGFRVLQPADLENCEKVYIENISNNLLLSVDDKNTNGTANVFGASLNDIYKQEWTIKKQEDGSYKICLANDGRCLEVFNAETTNGTNVSVYDETEDFINQKFYIYNLFGGYYIKPVCSDLFVDMTFDEINNIATYGYADDWEHQIFNIIPVSEYHIDGDCNADGKLTVADTVMLRKWLLKTDAELVDWKAADFNEDDKLDVFDFVLMKRKLISEN